MQLKVNLDGPEVAVVDSQIAGGQHRGESFGPPGHRQHRQVGFKFIHRTGEGDAHGTVGTVHHRILTAGTGLEQAGILLEAGVEDIFHAFDIIAAGRGLLIEAIEIDP